MSRAKRANLADAIADNIKLRLGDALQHRDDIPASATFDMMVDRSGRSFVDWVITSITKAFAAEGGLDLRQKEATGEVAMEIDGVPLDSVLIAEVFFILGDITKKEFVSYRRGFNFKVENVVPRFTEA
jgi:hypothetical protein